MGNKQYTADFDKLICEYEPGNMKKFIKICKTTEDIAHDERVRAWRVGCLYKFLEEYDESEHDICYRKPEIIADFMHIVGAAQGELSNPHTREHGENILKYIYYATGNKQYLKEISEHNNIEVVIQ